MRQSKNPFQEIEVKTPDHSWFDRSFDVKTTCNMGNLVPVYVDECLPGDVIKMTSEAMVRFAPMVAPIMHKVDVYIHNWFVPNRILWKNWEKYITGDANASAPSPAHPYLAGIDVTPSSLANYLGLPIADFGDVPTEKINALPFAAYLRVWYDYYRDQNLIDAGDDWDAYGMLDDGLQDAGMTIKLTELKRRAWEHDYFTSCLPFAQKGDPVTIPLDITADVDIVGKFGIGNATKVRMADDDAVYSGSLEEIYTNSVGQTVIDLAGSGGSGYEAVWLDPNGRLEGTVTNAVTSTTISDLRVAMTLQKWLELNARSGSRYPEALLANFGVRTKDYRLSRPEYIGGSKATMAVSEVLQTSSTDGTSPQANMAGHAVSFTEGGYTEYQCDEHGIIITLMSIMPKTAYFQGIPRLFMKTQSRFDYAFPKFAYMGEAPVFNKELYFNTATPSLNNEEFGYLPVYSEYRVNHNKITGQMAEIGSGYDVWHLGRKFAGTTDLVQSFIECEPTHDVFAVTDPTVDKCLVHVIHRISQRRPLPFYGSPGGL